MPFPFLGATDLILLDVYMPKEDGFEVWLTDEEFELVKRHPVIGYEILKPLRTVQDALPIVRWHHERLDGSGYPDGLKGDEIPLTAQVMAIADAYDALSTDRPYRKALPKEQCIAILREEAQKGWRSEELVEEFVEMIEEQSF